MIQATIAQAYHEILTNNLLSEERMLVYSSIFKHGPLTAGECFMKMQEDALGHVIVKGSVCARLSELRRLGCVAEAGKRKCSLTGKTVTLWKATNRLPIKELPRLDRVRCDCCKGKGYILTKATKAKREN